MLYENINVDILYIIYMKASIFVSDIRNPQNDSWPILHI